jgi:hypothetical protein
LENLQVSVTDYPGSLVCPWAHPGRYAKRVTTVHNLKTNQTIRWSDLNIHLILEHSFFEGKHSPFRLDPEELISIIFDK